MVLGQRDATSGWWPISEVLEQVVSLLERQCGLAGRHMFWGPEKLGLNPRSAFYYLFHCG